LTKLAAFLWLTVYLAVCECVTICCITIWL